MDASLGEKVVQTAAEMRFCVILEPCVLFLQVNVHVGTREGRGERLSLSESDGGWEKAPFRLGCPGLGLS